MSNLYDEVTGVPDVAPLEQQDDDALAREIEESRAFEAMYHSPAFQSVLAYVADQIDACKEKLIDANEQPEVVRLQQTARALSNFVGHLQTRLDIAKSLNEEAALRKQSASNTNGPA